MSDFKLIILVDDWFNGYIHFNKLLRQILNGKAQIEFRTINRTEAVQGIFSDNLFFLLLAVPPEDVMSVLQVYVDTGTGTIV